MKIVDTFVAEFALRFGEAMVETNTLLLSGLAFVDDNFTGVEDLESWLSYCSSIRPELQKYGDHWVVIDHFANCDLSKLIPSGPARAVTARAVADRLGFRLSPHELGVFAKRLGALFEKRFSKGMATYVVELDPLSFEGRIMALAPFHGRPAIWLFRQIEKRDPTRAEMAQISAFLRASFPAKQENGTWFYSSVAQR